jgi:sec-independent protein translocase protein TatB
VALIVIGPEQLPSAIRTAGLWIGRFRRSFYKVKSEIERELNADEIRRQLHNESVMGEIEDAKSQLQSVAKDAEESVNNIVNTDNFDPGASKQSYEKDKDEEKGKISGDKPEKPLQQEVTEELKAVGEQVESVKQQIYGSGKNPKLASSTESDGKPEGKSDEKAKLVVNNTSKQKNDIG